MVRNLRNPHDRLVCFKYLIISVLFFLMPSLSAFGQSYVPSALKPGSTAGSSSLSGFETISPYSGNLNFSLPLIEAGGRGSNSIPIKLNVSQRWMTREWYDEQDGNRPYPYMEANAWNINYAGKDIDLPVKVTGIQYGASINTSCPAGGGIYSVTMTILTFTSPDGTGYQMRDRNSNGQPHQDNCNANGYSRGTIFDTTDGSTATFISDTAIRDQPAAGYGEQVYWLYPSGNLITKDGTLYRIENGGFVWSKDRNGNKITLTYLSGSNFKITDSLNREITVEYSVQEPSPYGLCDKIT